MGDIKIQYYMDKLGKIASEEGIEALTDDRVGQCCEENDISCEDFKNAVIQLFAAEKLADESLSMVSGGKSTAQKGMASFMAALSMGGALGVPNSGANVHSVETTVVGINQGKVSCANSAPSSTQKNTSDNHGSAPKILTGGLGFACVAEAFALVRLWLTGRGSSQEQPTPEPAANVSAQTTNAPREPGGAAAHGFLLKYAPNPLPNTHEGRISAFEDTLKYCEDNGQRLGLECDGGRRKWRDKHPSQIYQYAEGNQLLDPTTIYANVNPNRCPQLWITNGRSFQSLNAVNYTLRLENNKTSENKVALLNFANYFTPGGGVWDGAGAQEESLCRVSTLYPRLATKDLWETFYGNGQRKKPLATDFDSLFNYWYGSNTFTTVVYTPDVQQIKDDTTIGSLGRTVEGPVVDVISAAAPDWSNPVDRRLPGICPPDNDPTKQDRLKNATKSQIRLIYYAALKAGCRTLVLGAFGCGAFKGSPKLMADAMIEVLCESCAALPAGDCWGNYFDNIIMPVYIATGMGTQDLANFAAFFSCCENKNSKFPGHKLRPLNLSQRD